MTLTALLSLSFSSVLSLSGTLAADKQARLLPWPVTENLLQDLADPPPKERPALFIPPRPKGAPTGREFLEQTMHLSLLERERRVESELLSGNIPNFLRHYVPVRLRGQLENGITFHGWAFVMPDYLAIGSDRDFIRVPMNPLTAQRVADKFAALLPTSKIVDAAFASARLRAPPHPLPADPRMRNNYYLRASESFIRRQLQFKRPGRFLTAGHKKDIVLSNRLVTRPKRVAIYGWHMPNGEAIQSLSTVHKKSYSDYSHAVRLVSSTMIVGKSDEWPYEDVLRHPTLWLLVSDEGPIEQPWYDYDEPQWTKEELKPL